ncbi:MAG TPA: EAL domain-containing protein [Bordetella sp.]
MDGVFADVESISFAALDRSALAVVLLDDTQSVVFFSRAAERLWGYTREEMLGRDAMSWLPYFGGNFEDSGDGLGQARELLVERKDGRRGKALFIRSLVDIEGKRLHMIAALARDDASGQDSEEQDRQRRIRDLERDCLEALTRNMSFDSLGKYLCHRIESIVPGVRASICRVSDHRLKPWAAPSFPQDYCLAFDGVEIGEGVASCGTAAYRGEPVMVSDLETDPLWAGYKHIVLPYGYRACWSYPIKRRDGSVAGTFAFYFKRSGWPSEYLARIAEASVHLCLLAFEREETRAQMDRLIKFDGLTGLPNRSHMDQHIDTLLDGDVGRGVALFMIDLDRLKDVNSALGHGAGDLVLVEMADRLQGQLRPGQFLGRFGGDQFLLAARDCDADGAVHIAGRLLEAVNGQIEIGGYTLNLSASVGISRCMAGKMESRSDLLGMVKTALLRVKAVGGGTYQFFCRAMNVMVEDRLLLSSELKQAIAANQLTLHYQPQVRSDSGEIYGFEALARWHNERVGAIPPDRFIPMAEETGQIDALGFWALRETCRQLSQWRGAGLDVPVVSVNLSPLNFRNPKLVAFLEGLLDEFGLRGSSLTIEITESTMLELTSEMLAAVHGIRALGLGLSVDDFGTGFASLSNLINLPLTEIKIDRSFVELCPKESRQQALVETVIGIGRSLGLTVVAEGVETPAQYGLLTEYHCPVLQGHFFAHPLDPADVPGWLNGHDLQTDGGIHPYYLG